MKVLNLVFILLLIVGSRDVNCAPLPVNIKGTL